jgi:hypothetical protein
MKGGCFDYQFNVRLFNIEITLITYFSEELYGFSYFFIKCYVDVKEISTITK